MSNLTFTLQQKSLSIRIESGLYAQKLSFQALLPKKYRLYSHEGKEVRAGHVTFFTQAPNHDTESIWFIDEIEDPDTGVVGPPSIEFYTLVSQELFSLLRDSNNDSLVELHINTSFYGAIRFADSLGYDAKWDTSIENPVPVESYEVILGPSARDAQG